MAEETSASATSCCPKRSKGPDDFEEDEKQHYRNVLQALRDYKESSKKKIKGTEEFVKTFPKNHQELLADYLGHLNSLLVCIDVNQKLFDFMIQNQMFLNHSEVYPEHHEESKTNLETEHGSHSHSHTSVDNDKCQAVLKSIVRDWSTEGQRERNLCYSPIIEELLKRYPTAESRGDIRVLVPGAGLGRLSHEIVRQGFSVEGNEFSLYMLFASNFILNSCSGKNLFKCFPWIHQNSNVLFHMDQTTAVWFPDIDPSDLPPNPQYSMTAGDFSEIYEKPEQKGAWDCVVTCFFIDCSKNIVATLEKILHCLKDDGVWINLGPLMYHYADMPEQKSIEPPYDFLAGIIRRLGFKIEKEILDLPTVYADNRRSMLSFSYKSIFLVCTKIPVIAECDVESSSSQEGQ